MNKAELISAVADRAEMTRKEASTVVDCILDAIQQALARGEKVSLTGFGTFEVRRRAARKGRNPQTGEEIQIPATAAPGFRAGKALKSSVR